MNKICVHIPITSDGDLACGCDSFRAMASARDLCQPCGRKVDDLIAAVDELAKLVGEDKISRRTARTAQWVRGMESEAPTPATDGIGEATR